MLRANHQTHFTFSSPGAFITFPWRKIYLFRRKNRFRTILLRCWVNRQPSFWNGEAGALSLMRLWHHCEKSLELNNSFYFFNIKMHSEFSLLQSVISSAYLMGISLFPTDKDSEMVKVERSGLLMFHRPSKNRLKTHIWKKAMGAPETPRGQVGSDSSSDAHRKKKYKSVLYFL